MGILHHAQRRATIKYRGQRCRGSGARGWLVGGVLDEKKREKSKRKLRPPFFIRSKTSSPFSRSATGRLHARSMQSPRSPHSVHGLPTCMCTRDAGAIAIVRAKFVLLGALSPGQKWRLYFRDFFRDFPPFFHATRAILREFWTFRRPRERGPSLHNPSLSFFPFPFFFLLFPPPPSPFPPFPTLVKNCQFSSPSVSFRDHRRHFSPR